MENEPFLLVELEDLSTIFSPLKTASRIKYTCFTVSNNFLIFGATSGGIYIFRREPCCFLQLLPNKEGSITQVAISPDEKLIAFSTIKGIVCITERSHSAKHLVVTSEHQNEQITCLQWNEGNDELFVGDTSGKVSIVTISIFPPKTMFQTPSFVLMQLDSKIVQMDFSSNMLLVSTLTKCYICDTAKEIFRQVGHKLRDGEYGACIFNTQSKVVTDSNKEGEKSFDFQNLSHLKLFCARPGSRVWEVAIDGTVISTHHFKEALAVPPRKIFFLNSSSSQNSDINNSIFKNGSCFNSEQINFNFMEQSFNFQKLYVLLSRFFFTFKSDGIYVFDPQKASVVLWNNEITNIVDVKCVEDVIYVWSGYGKVYALNFVPLEKLLVRLYFQKKFVELAKLCIEFETFLLSQADNCNKLYILHDLDEKLKSQDHLKKLCEHLKPFIGICKEKALKRKTQNAQKLKSGIYLVSNNDQLEDRRVYKSKLLRPSYLNLKGRSHSVSPERFQNGGMKHHGSSSSLPDLVKEQQVDDSVIATSPEIVVNGKERKEIIAQPEIDIEPVLKICESIENSAEPSKELVFNLFNEILHLSCRDKFFNFELIQPLNLNSYFNEDNVKLISGLFHSSLKSKLIFEWLSKYNGEWLDKAIKNYPEFLVKNHTTSSLDLDYKLSRALMLFSSILNENEIVDLVKETKMDCFYASLLKILDIHHDSSVSNLNLANTTSLPKFLNIVYFLISVGQIEQCSKYSNKIQIEDMFYLMLKYEESCRNSGKSSELIELQCHTLFLTYLDKASHMGELLKSCSDLIRHYVITCLEDINSTASCVRESNCSCGFPCPGLQPSIKMFPEVGHALIDNAWPRNPDQCLEICGKIPFLWKYFVFIRRNDSLGTLLPLLIQIGDMEELENRSDELNEQILEQSVEYLINLKKGFCLNCSSKIKSESIVTWSMFGLLCIKIIGPGETLELFQKKEAITSIELHQPFFQGLIFSSIMEKHSRGLRKSVVDLLMGRKTEGSGISVISEKHKKELFGNAYLEKFNVPNSHDSHHWGVKVSFKKNCTVCSLPLDTKVLISEAGLIVFKCSHAFHCACLRKNNLECPLCKNKSTMSSD